MALYYGKKQISGGRDYKTEHQMEDYSVSFVDDGEGYTDAAAALSEINSGSKFGKLFAAIKGCLMKFLSSISSLSSDLTALQNKATELQNTITELENKSTELQEKTTTLENGLASCNSYYQNRFKIVYTGSNNIITVGSKISFDIPSEYTHVFITHSTDSNYSSIICPINYSLWTFGLYWTGLQTQKLIRNNIKIEYSGITLTEANWYGFNSTGAAFSSGDSTWYRVHYVIALKL